MIESSFEKELKVKFEALEEMSSNNKNLFGLSETELIDEIQKLKYEYFRKGYLTKMYNDEQEL